MIERLRALAGTATAYRIGAVVILAIFGAAVFWGFPDSPSPWFDEGVNLGIAKTFAQDGVYSLRLAPGNYVAERGLMISTNYPVLVPLTLAFRVFGIGLAQAKIVMFLFLCAFLLVAYRFIALRSSSGIALASVALVITFLPFYGNGLSGGLGEVAGLVFLFAGLLFLESRRAHSIFFAGLLFGFAASTKVFYLILVAALGSSELFFAIAERRIPWKRWLLLGAGSAIPLFVWAYTLLPHGIGAADLAKTFAYYHNPYRVESSAIQNAIKFLTESTPIHFTLLAIPFFTYIFLKLRERKLLRGDLVLAVFVVLNVAWFLRTPGWYRYFFPAHLALLVVFPLMMSKLGARLYRRIHGAHVAGAIVLALIIVQAVHLVLERRTSLYYNPEPRQFAAYLDRTLGSNADLYIIDQPELWFLSINRNARQYVHMSPYASFGTDIFAFDKNPQYVVGANLAENPLLHSRMDVFNARYSLLDTVGRYSIYKVR